MQWGGGGGGVKFPGEKTVSISARFNVKSELVGVKFPYQKSINYVTFEWPLILR